MSQHKYGAKRTEVDGIKFDSKREAQRYQELCLLEKAGAICGLRLQPEFELHPWVNQVGAIVKPLGKYRGDFMYVERGATVVEDVKGFKTPLYKWKKRHVEAQYGITILET